MSLVGASFGNRERRSAVGCRPAGRRWLSAAWRIARLAAVSCCGALWAAEGIDRETVTVRSFDLVPVGNFRYHDDRTILHPSIYAGLGFDSNVFQQASEEQADSYQELMLGLDWRHYPSELSLIEIEVDLGYKNYLEANERDGVLLDADIEYAAEGVLWQNEAVLGVRITDDPAIETGRSIRRFDGGASWEAIYLGLLARYRGAAHYRRIMYLEDGTLVDAGQRDREVVGLSAGFDYDRSETSTIATDLRLFATRYDDDDVAWQDSLGLRAWASWEGALRDVHILAVQLGVEYRHFDASYADDAAYDDAEVIEPIGMVQYRWEYRAASEMALTLERLVADGFDANAVLVDRIQLGCKHRMPSDWDLFGNMSWFDRRSSGAPAGASVTRGQTWDLRLGSSYYFRRGLALRGSLTWRQQDSNRGDGFEQVVLVLDAALAF